MKILFIGDTHASWKILNQILHYVEYDVAIQLGDFGFFPSLQNIESGTYGLGKIKTQGKPFYWIPGNHEHWDHLENHIIKENYDKPIHVYGDIYHIPRGATFELNGKIFMGFGGAYSIDKLQRIAGISWFPQEQPGYADQTRLLEYKGKVDYFLAHTIPDSCLNLMENLIKIVPPDFTNRILEEFVKRYKPTYMYCGHWHRRHSFKVYETQVEVLSNIDWIDCNRLKTDMYNDDCYKVVEI